MSLTELNRARRGHQFYPTKAAELPPLYATDSTPAADKLIRAHYFLGGMDWWIAEYDPSTGEAFGYACLGDQQNAEWGYIPLTELEAVTAGPFSVVVERDLHWTPTLFRDVRHACGG